MKIEVKNLSKKFKKVTVVDNVTVSFKSGKIYGIVGSNGSGKSVFLKMLCAFYIPTEGCILQDGFDYIKANSFPRDTRALIETPSFIPSLTGYENLKLLASIQNKITDEAIFDALKKCNLYAEKDKKYGEYSLGMKQKLGIAQAIMENPQVIILDEPFNGIDEKSVKKIRDLLLKMKEENKLIIITSHIKEDIKSIADETYKFEEGKLRKYNVK